MGAVKRNTLSVFQFATVPIVLQTSDADTEQGAHFTT